MPMPKNLANCGVQFLDDGYLVIAYPEAEATAIWSGDIVLSIPVAYYSEEWDWLDGGFIYIGTEGQDAARAEARAWHERTSLTSMVA